MTGLPEFSPMQVNGQVVASTEVANTWSRRFRGLLGRRQLPEALWLEPESSVHGIGMRVKLDVALLDRSGVVVRTLVLRPFGLSRPTRGVVAILEAPVGSFERWGLRTGSVVTRGEPGDAGSGTMGTTAS